MYVHIGKDIIINSNDIVAIFDIESLEKKKNLNEILQNLKISDKIIDVSDDNQKTLVIVRKNKKEHGYITNISSITIAKRAETGIDNIF